MLGGSAWGEAPWAAEVAAEQPVALDDDGAFGGNAHGFVAPALLRGVAALAIAVAATVAIHTQHQDEVVPVQVAEAIDTGSLSPRATYSPEIVQWEISDDFAAPAASLPVDEEYDLKLRAYRTPPALFTAPANDEVVTPEIPETRAGHESQEVVVVGRNPVPVVFVYDDEIVPQAAQPALDEGEWQPMPLPSVRAAFAVEWHNDEIEVLFVDDEYHWTQPGVVARPIQVALEADEEIVPQPATLAVEDESWQAPSVQRFVAAQAAQADDDIVPQPVVFVPDEEYELRLYAEPREIRVQLSELGLDGPAIAEAALGVDEQYLLDLKAYRVAPKLYTPPAGDEVVAPAVPLPVDEECELYWQQRFARLVVWNAGRWEFGDDSDTSVPAGAVTVSEWLIRARRRGRR